MRLDSDDFELFDLPRRFALDPAVLDARRRELQTQVHPDRFVAQGNAAQRVAMQWAVRVNEAYRRLKDPLQRAAYLCQLGGVDIEAENNTAMPSEFLAEQMQWREALDDAASSAQVHSLETQVAQRQEAGLIELGRLLDTQVDLPAAAAAVRALMFVDRFAHDVDERAQALGQ
ncbi:MAG: Fe-S protein assembly co-chaperone HscB [Burkholderiaceae bacterium]